MAAYRLTPTSDQVHTLATPVTAEISSKVPAGACEGPIISLAGTLPAPYKELPHGTAFFSQDNTVGNYGCLSLAADGAYTYVLDGKLADIQALERGKKLFDSFSYTVSDGSGGSATNTLTVTICGTDTGPSITPASGAMAEDGLALYGCLPALANNDIETLCYYVSKSYEPGRYGCLTLYSNGSYIYLLNPALPVVQRLGVGDTLTETFYTTLIEHSGVSLSGTFSIIITGTDDQPFIGAAQSLAHETPHQAPLQERSALQNKRPRQQPEDTHALMAEGFIPAKTQSWHDTLTFIPLNAHGSYGTLTLADNGYMAYRLNNTLPMVHQLAPGDVLHESFNYIVTDSHGFSSENTLQVDICGTDTIPTISAATDTVSEDVTLRTTELASSQGIPVCKSTPGHTCGVFILGADGTYTCRLNTPEHAENIPADTRPVGDPSSLPLEKDGVYTNALDPALQACQALQDAQKHLR